MLNAGSINLLTGGIYNQTGGSTSTPTFVHNGGTVQGELRIGGANYIYNSGVFEGRLDGVGSLTLNADATFGNGMRLGSDQSISFGRTLTLNGAGLRLTSGCQLTALGLGLNSSAIIIEDDSTLNQNVGIVRLDGDMVLGGGVGAGAGTYNLNLGSFTMAGAPATAEVRVGDGPADTGSFNIGNAAALIQNLTIGADDCSGIVNLNGAAQVSILGTAFVGERGTGSLLIMNAGASISMSTLKVGDSFGTATGYVQIDAGTFDCSGSARIGISSAATFNHNGGAVHFGSDLMLDESDIRPVRLQQDGGALSVDGNVLNNGTMLFTGGVATAGNLDGTGAISMTADGSLTVDRVRQGRVTFGGPLNSTARIRIRPSGTDAATSRLGTITFAQTAQFVPLGTLDLTNNDLIVDYDTASALPIVRSDIIFGYNGGSWNGTGITSSSAAAAVTTDKTGLGYAEASDLFATFPAMFSGQSVDETTALVRYTLLGDANLDRSVNIGDFSILAANFNTASTWSNGDFNYDGTTNIGDFSLLASNFNQSVRTGLDSAASVPEATLLSFAFAAALKCRRRR